MVVVVAVVVVVLGLVVSAAALLLLLQEETAVTPPLRSGALFGCGCLVLRNVRGVSWGVSGGRKLRSAPATLLLQRGEVLAWPLFKAALFLVRRRRGEKRGGSQESFRPPLRTMPHGMLHSCGHSKHFFASGAVQGGACARHRGASTISRAASRDSTGSPSVASAPSCLPASQRRRTSVLAQAQQERTAEASGEAVLVKESVLAGRRGVLAAAAAAIAGVGSSVPWASAFEAADQYEVIGSLPANYKLPPVRFSPNAIKVEHLSEVRQLSMTSSRSSMSTTRASREELDALAALAC